MQADGSDSKQEVGLSSGLGPKRIAGHFFDCSAANIAGNSG